MTAGYDRPSARTADPLPQERRVAFHGVCEEPNPEQPGRFLVHLSPLFPFERDLRAWARLYVAKGEVRVWRREFLNGRFVRDVELPMMASVEGEA